MSRIQEIKARADAEMAQQGAMQQVPVSAPQGAGLPGISGETPMSRIQQIKMQADAAMAEEAQKQDKHFPYNAQQNRAQGSPYPEYVFTGPSRTLRPPLLNYENLTKEQKEVRSKYLKDKDADQKRRLKFLTQEVAGSPLGLADFGHGLYNLGNMITSGVGLTNSNTFREEEMPSHKIKQAMSEYTPIDLLKYQPQNSAERIAKGTIGTAGAALAGAGLGSLVSGLGAAGGAASEAPGMLASLAGRAPMLSRGAAAIEPYTTALLGAPQTLGAAATMGGIGGALGGGMQALAENGINASPYLLATLAALSAAKGGKWAAGKIKAKLPEAQGKKIAAERIKAVIGEDKLERALENIQEGQKAGSTYGHNPTTAELANNEGFSMMEDAFRGSPGHKEVGESLTSRYQSQEAAKQRALELARGEGSEAGLATKERVLAHEAEQQGYRQSEDAAKQAEKQTLVDQAMKEFEDTSTPANTGNVIRKGVKEELESTKAVRREKAGEKYDVVKNMEDRVPTTNVMKGIAEELKDMDPALPEVKKIKELQKLFEQEPGKNKYGLQLLDEKGRPVYVDKQARVLNKTRAKLNALKKQADISGDTVMSRVYANAKKNLDLDFEAVPQVSESWKTYAKESVPVNQINQDPFFKSILKETDYASGHVIPDSGIPHKLVNAAESSHSVASKFMNMFGKNKEVMKSVQGYINQNVLDSILDVNGVPSEAKIAAYLKKNQGSLTLYPELETKIANARNAGKFFHQVGDAAVKESGQVYKDMLKAVTESAPEKVVNNLLTGTNTSGKIDSILEVVNKDKTGQSMEGLRRAFVDHISEQVTTPVKFTNFYKAHKKDLGRIMTDKQMEFLSELNKHYMDKKNIQAHVNPPGSGTGSQTAPRTRVQQEIEKTLEMSLPQTILNEMLQSSGGAAATYLKKGVPGAASVSAAKGGWKWYKNAVSSSVQKNIQKSMLSPSFAEMMITDMTTKAGKAEAQTLAGKWAKDYIKGYAIKPITKKREEK